MGSVSVSLKVCLSALLSAIDYPGPLPMAPSPAHARTKKKKTVGIRESPSNK